MKAREEIETQGKPVNCEKAALNRRAFLKTCALAGPALLGLIRIEDSEATSEY